MQQMSVQSGHDVAVYRDQLDEIDRDEAASLIGNAEAVAARLEVSRRLAPVPTGPHRRATLAAVIVQPLGAVAVYFAEVTRQRRPSLMLMPHWPVIQKTARPA